MRGRLSLLSSDDAGSALVEGAVLLPLLIILFLGVFEFSWFFYQQHVASVGVRDGARYLARLRHSCEPEQPTWPLAEADARNLAATGSIAGNTTRVAGWTPAMVTIRCTPIVNPGAGGEIHYRGGNIIFVVTVATRFADPSLGFFGLLGLDAPTIAVSHSERVIGPG
jgi:hypothetical protein